MEDDLLLTIPTISSNAKFYRIDCSNYVMQQEEYGYNVKISAETFNLIQLVDGVKTLGEICLAYERMFKTKVPVKTVYNLLYEVLPQYGVTQLENYTVEYKKRERHLYLSFMIFNSEFVDKIVKHLTFLFPHKYFIYVLSILAIFTYTTIIINLKVYSQHVTEIFSTKFIFSFIIIYFVFIWHEFGHAAAGRKFSCKSKGIGFGFYWIIPVFFSDMSSIWRLKKQERITVNIGGIYFDLLNSTILLMVYFITRQFVFLVLPTILALSTLRNLNFFLKYDGYWIVSDLLDVPNLHKNSFKKLNELLKKQTLIKYSIKDYFLLIYAVVSLSYIFIIITILVIFNPNSIILFPKQFLEFIKLLLSNPSNIDLSQVKSLIIPSLFFAIVITKLTKYLIIRIKRFRISKAV